MQKLYVLLLTGCSSDPLDQKYTIDTGIDAIIVPGDTHQTLYKDCIVIALPYNDSIGITSEGKTFRELEDQGGSIWAERKAKAYVDSA